jgi:hypothetical protein
VKKIAANIRKRAEEFRETDRKKDLTIDIIKGIWHETRADSDRVIAELMNALTGTVCEKELIVKKQEITLRGEILRNGGKQGRSIITSEGRLSINRTVLKVTEETRSGLYPVG